jgi:hypothetical protein
MRRLVLSLIPFLCLAIGGAQAEGLVKLKDQPEITNDADALPRVLSGPAPAIIKSINAVLARLDAKAVKTQRECGDEKKGGYYARTAEATMQGLRFLSFVTHEGFFCPGSAHPDSTAQALVFDLSTGKLIDWEKLLPGKVHVKKLDASLEKEFPFYVTVSSDAIWALYKKAALADNKDDADCASALDEKLDFILYPDAKEGAVAVEEVGLRHAVKACGTTLYMSGDTLKSLGASKELIDALEAAHSSLAPEAKQ